MVGLEKSGPTVFQTDVHLETLRKILAKKRLHRRDVAKLPEIMRENFPWQEKAQIVYQCYLYKKRRHGWTIKTLAEYCEFDYSQMVRYVNVAEKLLVLPNLKEVGNIKTALEIANSKYPENALDGWMIENDKHSRPI